MALPLSLLAVALVTSLARGVSCAERVPTQLLISDRVLEDLGVFAGGMENELILCLGGRVRGDTAVIERWRMPRLQSSTPVSAKVAADACDSRRDLATWHNHPTGVRTQIAALQMGGPVGGDLCYLSSTDIRSALARRTRFQVLHNGRDRWCWWTLDEVKAFADSGLPVGYPAPGRKRSERTPFGGTAR